VIVDKDLLLNDLLIYIKLEALPVSSLVRHSVPVLNNLQASVILVNESYPSDCIQFRTVLNPSQLRFRVQGVPKQAEKEDKGKEPEQLPLGVEPTSVNELPIKPSRREQALCPESSQPSAEEVLQAVALEPDEEIYGEDEGNKINRERDALDDIIDEAKATSHLVNHITRLRKFKQLILFPSPWTH
jgi:DNA polymerase IV